jgi:hypothetical protein
MKQVLNLGSYQPVPGNTANMLLQNYIAKTDVIVKIINFAKKITNSHGNRFKLG